MKRVVLVKWLGVILTIMAIGSLLAPTAVYAQSPAWGQDQIIDNSAGAFSFREHVAISGQNAVAVWLQQNASHVNDLWSNCSSDGGATWSSPRMVELNDALAVSFAGVAIDGSNSVVVWTQYGDDVDFLYRVYSAWSNDGGASWSGPQLIDISTYNAFEPQVAISGQNVVSVWYQQAPDLVMRVYSNYSTNAGLNWGTAQLIEDNALYNGEIPQLAMSGSNVVAVWKQGDGLHTGIYSNYSTDSGATWRGAPLWDQRIDSEAGEADAPQVSLSGLNAVAVWNQNDGSYDSIYSNYSNDGGATWNPAAQEIENNINDANEAQVAVSGLNAVAVWSQRYDNGLISTWRIFSNYSSDGGAVWNPVPQLIENNIGKYQDGETPQVTMSGQLVLAVWDQLYEDPPGSSGWNTRMFSNYSTNSGVTWNTATLIEDNTGVSASSSDLAMSGLNAVAVWQMGGPNIYSNYVIFTNAQPRQGVGGTVEGVNILNLIAPWIILCAVITAAGALFMRRRIRR